MIAVSDIQRWQGAEEGQFFERKSAFDRVPGRPKQRKAADIARDIAETLSAMANAHGGGLVIGIEGDGTVTGILHTEDVAFSTPGSRLMHQSQYASNKSETDAYRPETDA
jgi:ATP-dependent DNA helicase RecG